MHTEHRSSAQEQGYTTKLISKKGYLIYQHCNLPLPRRPSPSNNVIKIAVHCNNNLLDDYACINIIQHVIFIGKRKGKKKKGSCRFGGKAQKLNGLVGFIGLSFSDGLTLLMFIGQILQAKNYQNCPPDEANCKLLFEEQPLPFPSFSFFLFTLI